MDQEIRLEMTKEEMQAWLGYDSTKTVLKFLGQIKEHYEQQLGNGVTMTTESTEKTAMQTAFLVGQIAGLNTVLNLKFDAA